jgi:hypothetical protein
LARVCARLRFLLQTVLGYVRLFQKTTNWQTEVRANCGVVGGWVATIAVARDLWPCFADHAPDSLRSLLSPHLCASSLESVRCQNVGENSIVVSPKHSPRLRPILPPMPPPFSSTKSLHQILLPMPPLFASSNSLRVASPTPPPNPANKSLHQHANTSRSSIILLDVPPS